MSRCDKDRFGNNLFKRFEFLALINGKYSKRSPASKAKCDLCGFFGVWGMGF